MIRPAARGDFPGHERLTAARRFVIEEDPAARVDSVALPVVHRRPVGEDLGDGVRAAWVERGRLVLRDPGDLPEHLGAGGLVEANLPAGEVLELANRLEEAKRPQAGDLSRLDR